MINTVQKTLVPNHELTQLGEFIALREQQKNAITNGKFTNKNSLSKNNHINQQKTKEITKNPTDNQAFIDLLQLLGEQLDEGHTVLSLSNLSGQQLALFKQWQQQGLLTILNTQNTPDIQTPLVLQLFDQSVTTVTTQPIETSQQNANAVIWLHRQWFAEHQLAQQLLQIAQRQPQNDTEVADNEVGSSKVNSNDINSNEGRGQVTPQNQAAHQPNTQQQLAIDNAKRFSLSIITGGPGTGKTFTVAKLVTQLHRQHQQKKQQQPFLPPLSIALTAPTGKAAQRMQASLSKSLDGETVELDDAKTLHRLLGINQNGLPRYHAENPLPYDLVIVDEASMLGLELASLLVDAIKPTARLVLLGDANQLSAVDAGSVLSDICQVSALQPYCTELTESKRFDAHSLIGQFARAVNAKVNPDSDVTPAQFNRQKLQQIKSLLTVCQFDNEPHAFDKGINFYPIQSTTPFWAVYAKLAQGYQAFFELMQHSLTDPLTLDDDDTRKRLFMVFDRYRILTAGHQGALGSVMINQKMAAIYKKMVNLPKHDGFFYHGLPIMITKNDYQLGLFNGDIGICVKVEQEIRVCFADKVIASSRLSLDNCEFAYAMTIHKSQGSEFDKVAVCLDRAHGRLLSQELVYTAVTRSKGELLLISEPKVLNFAVLQKGNRQTGLALQFDYFSA